MPVQTSEHISLALQFLASFFWGIGAAFAGPSTLADYLQLFAAVAWCLANFASAWHIWSPSSCVSSSSISPGKDSGANAGQNIEMASRVWMLWSLLRRVGVSYAVSTTSQRTTMVNLCPDHCLVVEGLLHLREEKNKTIPVSYLVSWAHMMRNKQSSSPEKGKSRVGALRRSRDKSFDVATWFLLFSAKLQQKVKVWQTLTWIFSEGIFAIFGELK